MSITKYYGDTNKNIALNREELRWAGPGARTVEERRDGVRNCPWMDSSEMRQNRKREMEREVKRE